MKDSELSRLMTTSDLVEYLRISRVGIWRKRKAGEFPPPCELGGQLRWRRDDIDAWIAKRPLLDPVCPPKPKSPPSDFGRLL